MITKKYRFMKMKFKTLLFIAACLITQLAFAGDPPAGELKGQTLNVYYLDNFPYCYKDKTGQLTGIEIDILKEFSSWVKQQLGAQLTLNFKSYTDFPKLYSDVKDEKDEATVGLASVTITPEREQEVKFTPPYLKNKILLVSPLSVPTVTNINDIEVKFKNLTAVALRNSVHEKKLLEIKAAYFPDMKIEYVETPAMELEKIASGKNYFGYVDIITFWAFLKNNPKANIKINKTGSSPQEFFGFIFPKKSEWHILFNEFFETGFGFTATKVYHNILEKNLSYEIINQVEIDQSFEK